MRDKIIKRLQELEKAILDCESHGYNVAVSSEIVFLKELLKEN
jgi:hypothetical protein